MSGEGCRKYEKMKIRICIHDKAAGVTVGRMRGTPWTGIRANYASVILLSFILEQVLHPSVPKEPGNFSLTTTPEATKSYFYPFVIMINKHLFCLHETY